MLPPRSSSVDSEVCKVLLCAEFGRPDALAPAATPVHAWRQLPPLCLCLPPASFHYYYSIHLTASRVTHSCL